ncbi:MAG: hypothetical protein ACR2IF_02230 [Terriglobales bacterium]
MPAKKRATSAKKKTSARRPAAKKTAARKSTTRKKTARAKSASVTPAAEVAGDRLTDVARTIGSTMGEMVAKAKQVLHREQE